MLGAIIEVKFGQRAASYKGSNPGSIPGTSTFTINCVTMSGFCQTIEQIVNLILADKIDEFGTLRPTPYAVLKTLQVLCNAFKHRPVFPRGCVTSDEMGGLRIEWNNRTRIVRLIVAHCEGGRSYIYHERCGPDYSYGIYNVVEPTLSRLLAEPV